MPKFLVNIDLNQNEIQNVSLQKLAIAPSNPTKGQVYYNTVDNRSFCWNGNSWVGMDSFGATMTAENIVTAINGSTFLIDDDNLSENVNDAISKAHNTHAISDVSGLQTALDSKETPAGATSKASMAENNAKAYTDTKLADLVGSAPTTLDTLNELAQALGDDPNFATTITNELAKKTDKYSQSIGDGVATSIVVTHNLNTRDVVITLRETASPYSQVITDVEFTSVNTITLKFAVAPTSDQYTVTIIG